MRFHKRLRLIEVLIAASIFGTLGVSVMVIMSGLSTTATISRSAGDIETSLDRVYRSLIKDLRRTRFDRITPTTTAQSDPSSDHFGGVTEVLLVLSRLTQSGAEESFETVRYRVDVGRFVRETLVNGMVTQRVVLGSHASMDTAQPGLSFKKRASDQTVSVMLKGRRLIPGKGSQPKVELKSRSFQVHVPNS